MNREQKRKFKADAKKHGFTPDETEYILNHKPNQPALWEGAKVKIDTVWMRFSPSWIKNEYRKEYKDWVLAHKDDVFTVVFDHKRKEQKQENYVKMKSNPYLDMMVCLEEDTDYKWYFYAGDLILQPGGTPKPKTLEELEEDKKVLTKEDQESKINEAIQLALEREKR